MQTSNILLNVQRMSESLPRYVEIKDPTVVQKTNGNYMMFASIGNSIEQHWKVGRFISEKADGVWQELPAVEFEDIAGPQLCAPAVSYEEKNGQELWTMYIQTACFEENGVIAVATSTDGHHFIGQTQPAITRESITKKPSEVIGVYDVGLSEVKKNDQELLCMLYSGYRRVGCGDIYMSYKNKQDEKWSEGECIIAQEEVPFHNSPASEAFEWGLEGAKLIQLADDCFVIIGVCFLPRPNEFLGHRQRVFMAASQNMNGPFIPIGLPFVPSHHERTGENGHPDTFMNGDKLCVVYQERAGDKQPWYLRLAQFETQELEKFIRSILSLNEEKKIRTPKSETIAHEELEKYYFNYQQSSASV